MYRNLSRALFIVALSSFIFTCDRPKCDTDNDIFINNPVTSNIYQTEVANQIQSIGIENLRFWLADYLEKDHNHYFIFYTQGDDLCAQVMVKVDEDDERFKDIMETKGNGRFNAEFVGLTFDITLKKLGITEFRYTGHDGIID